MLRRPFDLPAPDEEPEPWGDLPGWAAPPARGRAASLAGADLELELPSEPSASSASDAEGAACAAAWPRGRCAPAPTLPGEPTHLILAVVWVRGVPRGEVEAAPPAPAGRRWLGHVLDGGGALAHASATVAVLRDGPRGLGAPSRRRCVRPRLPLRASAHPHDGRPGSCEVLWGAESPGEVRVRLEPEQRAARVALLLGWEVFGVSEPLELRGSERRFFAVRPLFRPVDVHSLVKRPVSEVRLSLELWPPGSSFRGAGAGPAAPEAGPLASSDAASSYLSRCLFCDGLGRKRCDGCGGHGALVCRACDGMPTLPCRECGGTGVLQRGLEAIGRSGTGAAVAARRCTACWGSASAAECQACFGVGAFRCGSCCGAGWLPCTRCVPRGPTLR